MTSIPPKPKPTPSGHGTAGSSPASAALTGDAKRALEKLRRVDTSLAERFERTRNERRRVAR